MTRLLFLIAFALAGCATQEPSMAQNPNSSPPQLGEPPDDGCGASRLRSFVGQTLDAAAQARAATTSGARVVRVIRPGQAVTMDYSIDRLNIEVDEQDKVMSVRCG